MMETGITDENSKSVIIPHGNRLSHRRNRRTFSSMVRHRFALYRMRYTVFGATPKKRKETKQMTCSVIDCSFLKIAPHVFHILHIFLAKTLHTPAFFCENNPMC